MTLERQDFQRNSWQSGKFHARNRDKPNRNIEPGSEQTFSVGEWNVGSLPRKFQLHCVFLQQRVSQTLPRYLSPRVVKHLVKDIHSGMCRMGKTSIGLPSVRSKFQIYVAISWSASFRSLVVSVKFFSAERQSLIVTDVFIEDPPCKQNTHVNFATLSNERCCT